MLKRAYRLTLFALLSTLFAYGQAISSADSLGQSYNPANHAIQVYCVAGTCTGGVGGGGLTDAQLRAAAVHVIIDSSASLAVTGTFWQATQPVSGTFWQATQPVSGTFWQATQPVSGTVTTTPPSHATTDVTKWNTIALGSPSAYGTSPGAVNVPGVNAFITNIPHTITDATSVTAATLSAETTKVIGTARVIGNLGAAFDAAIGAAPPANAVYIAGLSSGATGGFMKPIAVCDSFVNANVVTATTVLLVTGVAGRHVRICAIGIAANGIDTFNLLSGTGATCGTGTTGMLGGTTAATGINLLAGGAPFTEGTGIGQINQTNATGDSVCLITGAGVQLSGRIAYTIY